MHLSSFCFCCSCCMFVSRPQLSMRNILCLTSPPPPPPPRPSSRTPRLVSDPADGWTWSDLGRSVGILLSGFLIGRYWSDQVGIWLVDVGQGGRLLPRRVLCLMLWIPNKFSDKRNMGRLFPLQLTN